MYLQRFSIEGIKCFDSIELEFPHRDGDYSGWIVLLGENGSGKSTLLQAMALTLIGPLSGQRLLLQPNGWIPTGQIDKFGKIGAEIIRGDQDSQVGQPRKRPYEVKFAVTGTDVVEIENIEYDQPQLVMLGDAKQRKALQSGPYGAKRPGWFSCGYGPFRRLSGGDTSAAGLVYSNRTDSRFATLFHESAALTTCQDWLKHLYAQSIDPHNPERTKKQEILKLVRKVIDRLLPDPVKIDRIDTSNVYFSTAGNVIVPIPDLSDGYRSFLALTVDILRHMVESAPNFASLATINDEGVSVRGEGVVLIDEVDAHLHPMWQRSIGFQLMRVFPKIQFIVTTHSPFIGQAAVDDGLIVLRPNERGRVEAYRPLESIKGYRADQILTSPLFGLSGTRDEETEDLIREHGELVAKREWEKLSAIEQKRLLAIEEQLEARMAGPSESLQEFNKRKEMNEYIEMTLNKLGGKK